MSPEPEQAEEQEQDPVEEQDDRIGALEEGFGRIEKEQVDQRGLLEQIRDQLVKPAKTTEAKAHAKAAAHTEDRLEHPPAETIADQVRKAVQAVNAEAENKRRQADHDADHQRLREQAERAPRQAAAGVRGRLQRAMYGRPDQ